MMRLAMRLFVSPVSIAVIDLLVLLPVVLAVGTVAFDTWGGKLDEPLEIAERIGVLLIGWGVALEERGALRRIFRTTVPGREAFEDALDELCHASGIGLLILGLFSEIGVAAIRLPNHITPTEGFDPAVLVASTVFIAVGAVILAIHLARLITAFFTGRLPQPH